MLIIFFTEDTPAWLVQIVETSKLIPLPEISIAREKMLQESGEKGNLFENLRKND